MQSSSGFKPEMLAYLLMPQVWLTLLAIVLLVVIVVGVAMARQVNRRVHELVPDSPAYPSLAKWNLWTLGASSMGAPLYFAVKSDSLPDTPLTAAVRRFCYLVMGLGLGVVPLAMALTPPKAAESVAGSLGFVAVILEFAYLAWATRTLDPELSGMSKSTLKCFGAGFLVLVLGLVAARLMGPVGWLALLVAVPAFVVFMWKGVVHMWTLMMLFTLSAAEAQPEDERTRQGRSAFLYGLGYLGLSIFVVPLVVGIIASLVH